MRNKLKLRFSLATLLIAVTAASIWLATTSKQARDQEVGVAGVESNEGVVQFETTLDVPDWLRNAVGQEYFRDETTVDFATNQGRQQRTGEPKATDANLRHLESLDSIEILELGNNSDVTDLGLAHLKSLRRLTTVYLYRTGIRGPGLVHLADLPKLEAISLSDTRLDDSGVTHLGRMTRLTWARLDNTKVTDASMSELAKATALKTLTLSNTEITDTGLMHLARLDRLDTLDVRGTGVTFDGVARLKRLLPNCQVTVTFGLGTLPQDESLFVDGYTPSSGEINAKLKELRIDGEVQTDATRPGSPIVTFRLFDSTLSNEVVLDLIEHMPDLEVLNLRRGLVGDDFVKGVGGLRNIKHLSLQATRITDDGLQYLSLLPNLKELILTETDVTDAGLAHLRSLRGVRSITLNSTRVTIGGIEGLRQSLPTCSVSW
ncbi:MAG: hypothetical protein KDA92_17350 [Planctomycetales bacterium]|nr:hypothetical protein [Planctomycetales bacterium]